MTKAGSWLAASLAALLAGAASSQPATGGCPPFPPPAADLPGGAFASTMMGRVRQHAPPRRHRPIPNAPLDTVIITLERGQCYGTCPAYKVELRGNGDVRFHGAAHVTVAGDHRRKVGPDAIACLLDDFRSADFWSLDPEYAAPVTDLPAYLVTLSIGGQTRSIIDYAGQMVGMPAAITALEAAIDRTAGSDLWVRGNAGTIAALDAEHFDFGGQEAGAVLAGAIERAPEELALALIARHVPLDGGSADGTDAGLSPIELAAGLGHVATLRALIDAGSFTRGGTALVSAALRASVGSQRAAVVAEILKYHPDVNARDQGGNTALLLIMTGAHPHYGEQDAPDEDIAIIDLLIGAGADPDIADRRGETALHHVNDPAMARAFIAHGAKLEARDADGNTPLLATFVEDVAIALLEAGADPVARNGAGQDFAMIARAKRWPRALAAAKARGPR